MKKIFILIFTIIFIFLIYKSFYIIKYMYLNYNTTSKTTKDIEVIEENSVNQSANNFINGVIYDLEMKYLYGEINEYPLVYTNNNLNIKGQKPIKVNLNLKENLVNDGIIEYEKYNVYINNGTIEKIEKK